MLLEIVKYRRWWYAFSALLLVPGLISLALYGVKLGIDFTGGSLLEVQTDKRVPSAQVREALGNDFGEPIVQTSDDNTYLIRLKTLDPDQKNQVVDKLKQGTGSQITERRFETVGPSISRDITQKAFISVVLGALLIVLYIAYAFRKVPKPASSWRFGLTTMVALAHDVIFTLGIFSLLGEFAGVELDATFVAAILTVLGFSVHDTIVVFDRIRENLLRGQGKTFEDTVNFSIAQTLVRSVNTSLTVLLVVAAMYLFGGTSIQDFVLALLVGIAIGTYSSIFNAAPVLVTWQQWSDKRAAKRRA